MLGSPILLAVAVAAVFSPVGNRLTELQDRLDLERIAAHLRFLASDELAGRAVGTPGADRAADYLAEELWRAGVQSAFPDQGYFQLVPLRGSTVLPGCRLEITLDDRTIRLRLGDDYLLYREGAETLIPHPVPLVFAGYGIVAPEFDYNSYQGIDVAGKVVVVLSGEPESADPRFFQGDSPTVYGYPEAKHRLAVARGARGTIVIPGPSEPGKADWQRRRSEFAFEHVISGASAVGNLSLLIRPEAAVALFDGAATSLAQVFEQERRGEVRSFPLPAKLSFHGEFRQREFVGRNVVGMIPGSDPKWRDSYVLVTAHYDGLGVGPAVAGDSIYNGVLDNAAGAAVLLELARVLNTPESRPRRSVLILFPTAEEKGLLGSYWYTLHPARPVYRTVAQINLDGIAFLDTFDEVLAVGAELSTLDQLVWECMNGLGLGVARAPSNTARAEAFLRSDQVAFAEAGIPSLLLLEGFRYRTLDPEEAVRRLERWNREVYHTPFDDLHQPIHMGAVLQHSAVALALALYVAEADPPQWKSGVPYLHARLQSIAEKR